MESMTRDEQRAIVAELLATMFFVFVATGAVVSAVSIQGGLDSASLTVISVAFGFAIMVGVAWSGGLSGGHLNPAVTLAMMVTKKTRPALGAAYIVAQLAGAVAGSLLLKLVTPAGLEDQTHLGANGVAPGVDILEGLGVEVIMTAFLVWVVFNVAVSTKGWAANAPIAIGSAVMLIHFVSVPLTGTSVNPARSFGPALVEGQWADFWVFIAGPAIGAVVAAMVWLSWQRLGETDLDPGTL